MFPEWHVKTWIWWDTWYWRTLRWALNDGCPDENYLSQDPQSTESRPCCLYRFVCPRQWKQVTHSITFSGDVKHLACPQWPGFGAGSATFRPVTTFGRKWEVREIGQSDSIFHWSKELPGRKSSQHWNFSLYRGHFAKVQVSSQQRPVWTVHGRNSGTCVFCISLSDDIWREITVYIHWQNLEAHCSISLYIFIAFDRVAVSSSRDEIKTNLNFYKWTAQTSCGFRGWISFFSELE